ncbi:MAG: cell envelope integrity protein TolA, partial [Hylemonella sp.]|nr:cell envelope integrity protein TolA [Hylemonella sp.]
QAEAEAKEKKAKAAQEAKEKKKKAQEDKLKAKQQAEQIKKLRAEQMKRMMGLAGGSGEPSDSGSSERSAAPSAGYAGRIRARIRPNIVFTDNISGNPAAEVEVRTSPDGTIVGSTLIKPSGVKSWDEAVLKAIQKTEVLPRDVDGRVPPSLVIVFRPRD